MPAQRGYYQLPSADSVLAARIDALRQNIPRGQRILDLGCNDGTIGRALLQSGHATEVHGVDLENILNESHPNFHFSEGNLSKLDLNTLPEADAVLMLNVLHHVIRSSRDRAIELLNHCLARCKFLILDMGSLTEQGEWGWRRKFGEYWSSDGEMWDELFANVERRFKLLRYPTQGTAREPCGSCTVRHPFRVDIALCACIAAM